MRHNLLTYKGVSDLRKIEEDHEVIPFIFQETLNRLQDDPQMCLDITALIYYIRVHPSDRYPAYMNLRAITEETTVIVDEEVASEAIACFPLLFSESAPYIELDSPAEEVKAAEYFLWTRQPIYTYSNVATLNRIVEYADTNMIPIATFSRASGTARDDFEKFNKTAELALIDLTSVSHAIDNNKNLIYLVESFLNLFPNIRVIAQISEIDNILGYFPLYLEGQKPVQELIPGLEFDEDKAPETDHIIRIVDLEKNDIDSFFSFFKHNLIGHSYFKERLEYAVKNFIVLNKVKEQKVLSIFLYGSSGIGKTEVARLIANGLREDGYLAKINFQNYSSQDALNSLIGSPAGYIGCDHGELSDKIGKTKIGVLLCDEFDKTTRPVFLFFLELLEEGRFTDSMAREYDLDGFIIVFTSNIQTENEYKQKIPLELQTRFDLVCEFEQPSIDEKRQFLELLLEKAKNRHSEAFSKFEMTADDKLFLLGFDCSNLIALRDIKRVFNNRLVDLFEKKGVSCTE